MRARPEAKPLFMFACLLALIDQDYLSWLPARSAVRSTKFTCPFAWTSLLDCWILKRVRRKSQITAFWDVRSRPQSVAKMVSSYLVLLILSQLSIPAAGLQVTPNSACAELCMDDPTTDISDPNSSSTNGSDIVCTDSAYTSTSVGQKFNSCISCLQNSTANATSENDQEWFLCKYCTAWLFPSADFARQYSIFL